MCFQNEKKKGCLFVLVERRVNLERRIKLYSIACLDIFGDGAWRLEEGTWLNHGIRRYD